MARIIYVYKRKSRPKKLATTRQQFVHFKVSGDGDIINVSLELNRNPEVGDFLLERGTVKLRVPDKLVGAIPIFCDQACGPMVADNTIIWSRSLKL